MGLWNPGTMDITMSDLDALRKLADESYDPQTPYMRQEYGEINRCFIINELVPYKSDVDGEYHILCEFTYNTEGHRAGFGLRTSDRQWVCFYD
jgi:hypothetical protein